MKKYSVVILVIASDDKDFYINFIENYWKKIINYIKEKNYSIKVFLLFSNKPTNIILNDEDIIISNTVDGYTPGILMKTIYAFDYVNKNIEYKHILRTNLSSFFLIEKILKISKNLNDTNVYAGILGITGKNNYCQFISGSGFWLSKDNVDFILKNKNNLNYDIIDDVAIGLLLYNKPKIKLKRYDILANTKIFSHFDEIEKNHYHVRLKTGRRNIDVMNIKFLTKYFYKL